MRKDRTILITGATGMIGSLIVRKILEEKSYCRMILPVRSIKKAQKIYEDLSPEDYQKLRFIPYRAKTSCLPEHELQDIHQESRVGIESLCRESCPELYQIEINDIIHCACVTQSEEMFTHPVETADSIVNGTKNVLELAREKQADSMVYLSSMEVYGKVADTGEKSSEEELGSLDLNSPRSCYPVAKRMAEHYCHIYQKEYGVPVKIARLAQTFGRGVRPEDRRVYMQFARAAYEKKNIVLRTYGTSIGNYCHTQDAADAILCILESGCDGEAYNVVNEKNTMSIREMAELVVENFGDGEIEVIYDVSEENRKIYAADTGLRLSSKKLQALGWKPKKDLVQMYHEIMEALSDWSEKGEGFLQ